MTKLVKKTRKISPSKPADKQAGVCTQDKVDELKGKYHLKTKHAEAYREQAKKEIYSNNELITLMRKYNKQTHKTIADGENADTEVIKSVFEKERETKLSLKRYSANQAIEEMDQRVCGTAKFLNAFRYEREKRQKKLEELKQELERLKFLGEKSPQQLCTEESVTKLENELDKALIKGDTAKMITDRYVYILENLKKESATLPVKLDAMENALIEQRLEIKKLQKMSRIALTCKDESKKDLYQVEMHMYELKKERDAEITATRKEVERRQLDIERGDKRYIKLNDGYDEKSATILQQKRAVNQRKMLSLEEAFARIKEACHVHNLTEAVERVQNQKEINNKLNIRMHDLECLRNRLGEEKLKLGGLYQDMKFSGDKDLSSGEKLLEQIQEKMGEGKEKRELMFGKLQRNGTALMNVKFGISTLLEKLSDVKLKPPLSSYTKGDVFEQLDLITKKNDKLVNELVEYGPNSEQPAHVSENILSADFQEFLESLLSADNLRIQVKASESQISELGYDGHENDVLTRNDIKRMAESVADSKQKNKKKGKKKK